MSLWLCTSWPHWQRSSTACQHTLTATRHLVWHEARKWLRWWVWLHQAGKPSIWLTDWQSKLQNWMQLLSFDLPMTRRDGDAVGNRIREKGEFCHLRTTCPQMWNCYGSSQQYLKLKSAFKCFWKRRVWDWLSIQSKTKTLANTVTI